MLLEENELAVDSLKGPCPGGVGQTWGGREGINTLCRKIWNSKQYPAPKWTQSLVKALTKKGTIDEILVITSNILITMLTSLVTSSNSCCLGAVQLADSYPVT